MFLNKILRYESLMDWVLIFFLYAHHHITWLGQQKRLEWESGKIWNLKGRVRGLVNCRTSQWLLGLIYIYICFTIKLIKTPSIFNCSLCLCLAIEDHLGALNLYHMYNTSWESLSYFKLVWHYEILSLSLVNCDIS